MTEQIVPPPCSQDVYATCEIGFHNPPGQPCICVENEPQPVPTLDTWALIGLLVVMLVIGLNWIWRRNWT